MQVYGDRPRTAAPHQMLAELADALSDADAVADEARRDRLTGALIAAGDLAQGLADAEFEARGCDHLSPTQDAAMALCVAVARRLFKKASEVEPAAARLAALTLPDRVRCKTPEGYAFYAVYPESYFAAAAARPWPAPPLVLGLRSIGTSLAAAVAAATGGRAISLRPCGHPFARQIRASEALKAQLRTHPGPFAVVDEGPGLSGSSFGAVADLLEELGVAPAGIVFFPSHAGEPGPQASARHRARWAGCERRLRTLDDLLADEPMATWFEDLIGPAQRVDELSAGAWRRDRATETWPPVAASQERRKYRLVTADGVYLARFAGLGTIGTAKHARARALADAGFTAEPLALRRGFLLERWVAGAPLREAGPDRAAFLAHLGRYLGFRALSFPAGREAGASVEALREMAVQNTAELHGPSAAAAVGAQLAGLLRPGHELRPVQVDARLQPWEWLRRPDGSLCKTDALDHAEAHDLAGCQDIAWDVAGAAVEFDLSCAEVEHLAAMVAVAGGRAPRADAIEGFRICYAALHAAVWSTAAAGAAPSERVRIAARQDFYAARLAGTRSGFVSCSCR